MPKQVLKNVYPSNIIAHIQLFCATTVILLHSFHSKLLHKIVYPVQYSIYFASLSQHFSSSRIKI